MDIIEGYLYSCDGVAEQEGVLMITQGPRIIPFAEVGENYGNKQITVRYWLCNERASVEAIKRAAVETVLGRVSMTGIHAHYSELTGHLWTDEDFVVGGHNLVTRLKGHEGEYLYMEIES